MTRVRWVVEDAARPGGVEAVVRRLDADLRARGLDSQVESWLPADPPQGHATGPLGWIRAKVSAARRREKAAATAAEGLRARLTRERDLVVVLDPGSLSVARRLVGQPRWGVHVHWSPDLILTPWRFLPREEIPRGLLWLVKLRLRAVSRGNARILRSSPFLVSLTASHTRALRAWHSSVREIPNPVEAVATRRLGGEVEGTVTLGFLGRLDWVKGPDLLLRALTMLDESVGGIRTVLVGSGPAEVGLRALAQELGLRNVEFAGWTDDPRTALEQMDVLVLPSRSEAVPLVLVEALAAGCRIVAADAGAGVRDVLLDGELGAIVPIEDTIALGAALRAAVRDVRLGRWPAPDLVAERVLTHSPERVVQLWLDFLEEQVGSGQLAQD